MGTRTSQGWNNNKRSYTAVLHRYIESTEKPSSSGMDTNNHSIEMVNHLSGRPAGGDISPETNSSYTDKSSFDSKAHPKLPGIPLPLNCGVEMTGDGTETKEKKPTPKELKTMVFNFLEGHKTFSSRVYHHFM